MERRVVYTLKASDDIYSFKRSGQIKILKKIDQLVDAILENPFEGIGKPEELKYELSGCWSRRINKEHRLVYKVMDEKVTVLSAKGHY